jgi:hypothetical protein
MSNDEEYDDLEEGDINDIFANVIDMGEQPESENIRKPLEIDDLNGGDDEVLPSPNIVRYRSLKKKMEPEVIEKSRESSPKVSTPVHQPITQPVHHVSPQQPAPSDLLSAIEALIDKKMTAMKTEFSSELEKVKQSAVVHQQPIVASPPKKSPEKVVNIDIDSSDETDGESIVWLKRMCRLYRDENEYLKETLSLREQEMDNMVKTIDTLSKVNEDLNTELQNLQESQKYIQSNVLQLEPEIIERPRIQPFVPRLPIAEPHTAPIHKLSNVDNILTKVDSLPGHHLSKQRQPQHQLNRSNTSPVRRSTPNALRRPQSASSMRRTTQNNTMSSAVRNSINSQHQIQQLQQDPQMQQRLDLMADRIMKSLRGVPPADENYKEVDRMVENIRAQFQEKGIYLPLKKHQNCIYILGNTEPFKRKRCSAGTHTIYRKTSSERYRR